MNIKYKSIKSIWLGVSEKNAYTLLICAERHYNRHKGDLLFLLVTCHQFSN